MPAACATTAWHRWCRTCTSSGLVEAISIPQRECFAAALQFARSEGIVPAPEPTHALAAAIREALACKESGESKVILTALCGHGHLDLAAYQQYLSGEMIDYELPDAEIAAAMVDVPGAHLSAPPSLLIRRAARRVGGRRALCRWSS